MSLTLDQVREEALALPVDDRRRLFASLCDSLDEKTVALHPEWQAELEYRSAEYRAGRMGGVTLEEFERELDETQSKQ